MKRFTFRILIVVIFLLPASALIAGGGEETTSTTTTTTAKKKVRVKVKRTASKKLERRKVRKRRSHKLPVPIDRRGKERAGEGDDEEGQDIDFQHVLERTADYLRSPDGAANTARCFAAIGNGVLKARKEEKKKLVAAGLVSTVQDAFRDSVREENWNQEVRRVRQIRHVGASGGRVVRRLGAVEIVDIAEEVTTGCFFPYLRHVLRKTDAEKIVDENKYIDNDKLAGDIATAIAGAIAVGAKDVLISEAKGQINDKIEEAKDTVEGLVQDIVEKAKGKIAAVGEATKKLVEKLTPDIIENAVAQAKAKVESWLDWDDDDDSLESIVTELDSDADDTGGESEYEYEEEATDDEPFLVAADDEIIAVTEVVDADESEGNVIEEKPKWSPFDLFFWR